MEVALGTCTWEQNESAGARGGRLYSDRRIGGPLFPWENVIISLFE